MLDFATTQEIRQSIARMRSHQFPTNHLKGINLPGKHLSFTFPSALPLVSKRLSPLLVARLDI